MKKKLLIVERDTDILQIIMDIFRDAGYQVSGYTSEEGILEKIFRESPDAILLDVVRPTLQGTALCRAIKATEKTRHVPVIALSTHLSFAEIKKICADEVLAKPFDIDELIETIDRQVEH
ncbi:response regulator [Hufsiella ginkgonis]|uniref:Response regulator n=1 Tax=Hufsiella ginkgonis TaxID=2695274 RepID=A0A7K1XXD8_9SPHI|nr:response regulator [Hufsiella ginkgonis]MXV15176.1 response regulator [Hufsiella ginkgonis]